MKKIKTTDIVLGGIAYRKVDDGYGVYTYTEDLPERVVVPEKIEGTPVTVLLEKCFADSPVCQVILPDSLHEIGDWAFRNCLNLTEIKVPDHVTEVGYAAFKKCKNLRRLELGRHTKTAGWNLCEDCKSIEEFIVWNEIEFIGGNLFWGGGKKLKHTEFCYGLYLGNPEDPYVMLNGNVSFEKGEDPVVVEVHPNTKLITSRAFNRGWDGAVRFADIDLLILHDNLRSVQGGAFSFSFFGSLLGDNGVEVCADSIEMLCRSGGNAVRNCRKLVIGGKEIRDLFIPKTVKNIPSDIFADCRWLESVTFEGDMERIGYKAFQNCKQLKTIQFSGQVKEICGDAFLGCISLEKLELPDVEEIGRDAFALDSVKFVSQLKEEFRKASFARCADRGLKELRFNGKVGLLRADAFAMHMRLETVIGLENIESVEENSDPFRYTPFADKLK